MIKIENLDKFRGKMKWTTVTEDGKVTISVGPKKYTGTIGHSVGCGYYVDAETDLMETEAKMDEAIAKLSEGAEASSVINELKDAFEKKEGIAEGLKTIEAIKNYFNEEVTVKKGE